MQLLNQIVDPGGPDVLSADKVFLLLRELITGADIARQNIRVDARSRIGRSDDGEVGAQVVGIWPEIGIVRVGDSALGLIQTRSIGSDDLNLINAISNIQTGELSLFVGLELVHSAQFSVGVDHRGAGDRLSSAVDHLARDLRGLRDHHQYGKQGGKHRHGAEYSL